MRHENLKLIAFRVAVRESESLHVQVWVSFWDMIWMSRIESKSCTFFSAIARNLHIVFPFFFFSNFTAKSRSELSALCWFWVIKVKAFVADRITCITAPQLSDHYRLNRALVIIAIALLCSPKFCTKSSRRRSMNENETFFSLHLSISAAAADFFSSQLRETTSKFLIVAGSEISFGSISKQRHRETIESHHLDWNVRDDCAVKALEWNWKLFFQFHFFVSSSSTRLVVYLRAGRVSMIKNSNELKKRAVLMTHGRASAGQHARKRSDVRRI